MATEQFTEYSSTPANNISPSPVGAPPGMAPSGVRPELQEMQSVISNVGQQLATLTTFYEGTSPPTLPTGVSALPGMMWHDTSTNELRMMSQDGTTWIELGAFNETNHLFTAALAAQAATASTAAVANALSGVLGIGGGGTSASTPGQAVANLLSGFASGVLPQSLGGLGSGSLTTALAPYFQDSFGANGYRRNHHGRVHGPVGGDWFDQRRFWRLRLLADQLSQRLPLRRRLPISRQLKRRRGQHLRLDEQRRDRLQRRHVGSPDRNPRDRVLT